MIQPNSLRSIGSRNDTCSSNPEIHPKGISSVFQCSTRPSSASNKGKTNQSFVPISFRCQIQNNKYCNVVMPKLGITLFLTGRHDHILYIHSYLGIPSCLVYRQFGSFYEVWVNSREGKLTWNCFICVCQHKFIGIYLFSH